MRTNANEARSPFWKRHLDQVGVAGSLFAALCCLGFPALLAVVSAAGLGFLVNDAILVPLLAAFLIVTLWGLYLGKPRHGEWSPFLVGLASAVLTGSSVWFGSGMVAGIGIAGLIGASLLNVWLRMRQLRRG